MSKKIYGLIGKRLDYSFSKNYFTRKFEDKGINARYINLETNDISNIRESVSTQNIIGLNITNPYKQEIIEHLDGLSQTAMHIKAVNCIAIEKDHWFGHNTDVIGFEKSLLNLINNNKKNKALIFGTGGASKAIQFVLEENDISFQVVSRNEYLSTIQYQDITESLIQEHKLLINATPLGTFPNIDDCVQIQYDNITAEHYCFDVVYNPDKSEFLTRAQDKGATIMNGMEMLEIQAEESWKIWNS